MTIADVELAHVSYFAVLLYLGEDPARMEAHISLLVSDPAYMGGAFRPQTCSKWQIEKAGGIYAN